MIARFLQKTTILLGVCVVFGYAGFVVPMLFDRDVGGAIAAPIFAIVGVATGAVVAMVVIRRIFD